MLAKSKEQDLTEVFKGPVMILGIGVAIIASLFTIADTVAPTDTQTPDEKPLFGDTITNIIDEGVYYLRWIMYLAIIVGGIMVAASLRIRFITHDR